MSKPRPKIKGHKRSCGAKKKYSSLQEAGRAARRGRWDFMEPYRCRKCKLFHYGHPSAKHVPQFAG